MRTVEEALNDLGRMRASLDAKAATEAAAVRMLRELQAACPRGSAGTVSFGVWQTQECATHRSYPDVVSVCGWDESATDRLLCGCQRPFDLAAMGIATAALVRRRDGKA